MKSLLATLMFSVLTIAATAQIFTPVKWSTSLEKISDTEYAIQFVASIDAGWYVYSADMADDGPVPTTIDFDTEDGYELVGELKETGKAKKGYDSVFEMDVTKYADKVTFTQTIRVDTDLDEIEGYLSFMTCDDKRCLPPADVDFSFELE